VHFFSLDDFAGHEIETILEDGEHEVASHNGDHASRHSQGDNQSVRPGSIVSNIDQRLDELEGLGPAETDAGPSEPLGGGEGDEEPAGARNSAMAAADAQYHSLLQEMQHRELTPADLQLLMMLEHERTAQQRARATCGKDPWGMGRSATAHGAAGASGWPTEGGGSGWGSGGPDSFQGLASGAGSSGYASDASGKEPASWHGKEPSGGGSASGGGGAGSSSGGASRETSWGPPPDHP
jgi:hypothetical protein